MCIENDFYSAELDTKGNKWIFKAKPLPKKRKKIEYKDPARFKIINQFEGEAKRNYNKMTKEMTKNILSKFKEFIS